MPLVYLSLGSNEEREHHIGAALDMLQQSFGELRLSSVYEAAAVGFAGDSFYNLVAAIETALPVGELSRRLKDIEDVLGRRRDVPKFSGRTIDIDILTYGDRHGVIDGVELPRQEITENAFVLWPLAELAPDDVHPACGLTYGELWRQYEKDQALHPVPFLWQGRELSGV